MAEICLWLLYIKITSEHSSAFVGIFKNLIHARGFVHKAEEKEEMLQAVYG
jgi:hypothetical protein